MANVLKRQILFNGMKLVKRCVQTAAELEEKSPHVPVMVNEVLEAFKLKKEQTVIDMTFGAGGHTKAMLEHTPNIKVLALDRDSVAFEYAQELSKQYPQVIPMLGKFSDLPQLLREKGIKQRTVDAVLFDLGCSSMQFDVALRGFSVSKNGPLDMRMDGWKNPDHPTAADVLTQASEADLVKIFKVYGEEKHYKKIARAVIEARYTFKPLKTTKQLCELVEAACGCEYRQDMLQRRSHIATKIFQALRIFVNNEVNELNYGMILAHRYLKIHGTLCAISFHSIEDTIVKRHLLGTVIDNAISPLPQKYTNFSKSFDEDDMKEFQKSDWKLLSKHVILPTEEEVERNPRSRSAKLRCAMRIN